MHMKKIGFIIAALLLVGAGCANTPAEITKKTGSVVVSGQIVSVAQDSFVLEAGETKQKNSIVYSSTTRFAEPDGSGIGGPITKPQIEPGLQVEVQGEWQEDGKIKATNIIFNAE